MPLRTCHQCHAASDEEATFCGECGIALAREPVAVGVNGASAPTEPPTGAPAGAGEAPEEPEAPTVTMPPPAWAYGPPMPPQPPAPPIAYPSGGYPAQSPPPPNRNTGLIVGLAVASVVALVGTVAAVLLALGGEDEAPVAASAAPATQAQPTVTVIRERSTSAPDRPRSRSNGSRRNSDANTRAATSSPTANGAATRRTALTDTARRTAAENAVRRHWRFIESGDYDAAFDLLASSATSAGRSTWVSEHAEDALSSADLSVSATLTSPTTARVDVLRLRTIANSGCFNWSGSYDVAKNGTLWHITKANLERLDTC